MSWNVKIPRERTLEIVQHNRDNHKAVVAKALDGYRDAVIVELERRIDTIKAGKPIDTYLHLPQPEDHTNEYETIIGMLEMCTEDTIEVSPGEFRAYVEDKWDWKDRFVASTAAYVS